MFLDNGVSSEVPTQQQGGNGQGRGVAGERLSAFEAKLARLEAKPRMDNRMNNRENKKNFTKPLLNGKELCFEYNSRTGCKRTTVPGGCKVGYKEYAHACAIWLKDKSSYCLMSHPRKYHK